MAGSASSSVCVCVCLYGLLGVLERLFPVLLELIHAHTRTRTRMHARPRARTYTHAPSRSPSLHSPPPPPRRIRACMLARRATLRHARPPDESGHACWQGVRRSVTLVLVTNQGTYVGTVRRLEGPAGGKGRAGGHPGQTKQTAGSSVASRVPYLSSRARWPVQTLYEISIASRVPYLSSRTGRHPGQSRAGASSAVYQVGPGAGGCARGGEGLCGRACM